MRFTTLSARLGFAVGVFFCASAPQLRAQVVGPPASEVPVPPKPETDTTARPRGDTIQAPFGRTFIPRTSDIGPQYEWSREEMFASGALTVSDLLERVPELTSFRTGWLPSPKYVAMNGDLDRVRIFYDGIEMDNLDPKSAPLLDLTTVELWTLEHIAIQRFANEIQLHLRSWRADRTNPNTRTDVLTGDEDTNIYRGFYGKRWGSGFGLQLAGQQFSTRAARLGGSGDALSFMGRIGIARRTWSLDAFGLRRSASRSVQPTFSISDGLSIPQFEGTHNLYYLRGAVGNQGDGPWAEIIASYSRFADRSDPVTAAEAFSERLVADTTDTTVTRFQYVATAGLASGPLRIAVTERARAFGGEVYHAPAARLEVASTLGMVGAYAETDQFVRATRGSIVARITPIPFIALAGSISASRPYDSVAVTASPEWTSARVEAGIRVVNPWIIGGFITRDTASLVGPMLIDTAYKAVAAGRRQGLYAGIRGKLYKDINVDVVGTRWDSAGYYQPRYQSRSEVNITTRWLTRFPSGTFGLKAAFIHEYRDAVTFPTETGSRRTVASHVMSGLLEIRILRGIISYQVRNIASQNHQLVPDFFMPRTINVYGIRWEFWN